jgi:hypothetical protein
MDRGRGVAAARRQRIAGKRGYGPVMANFFSEDLRGFQLERVDLSDAQLRAVDLSGARFRGVDLSGVVMRGVELVNADIHGEVVNVTVNGVDVGPLVEAELNRRYPDRAKMRPADPAGFREAWDILEQLWDQTLDRARRPGCCTSRSETSGRSSRRCVADRLDGQPGDVLRSAHGHAAEADAHRWCTGVQECHRLGREQAFVRQDPRAGLPTSRSAISCHGPWSGPPPAMDGR